MIVGVHIVKSASWRGKAEEWENTYHYDTPAINSDDGWSELIDDIVTVEKTIHSVDVSFVRALIHGPTNGTKEEDVMIFAKDLTGTGSIAGTLIMPRELTVVAQLYMGRSGAPHFRKTFLRKYWHAVRMPGTGVEGSNLGNTALSASQSQPFKDALNALKNLTVGAGQNHLCKPNGQHIPALTDAQVLPYAHTRQFRR